MRSNLTKLVIELRLDLIELSFLKTDEALLVSLNERRYRIITWFGFYLERKKR